MKCSGCGKDIPFDGQVCPYCQRDKSADQLTHSIIFICVIVGGGIGYMFSGFVGLVAGAFLGAIVGSVVAISSSSSQKSQPPQVRVIDSPASSASSGDYAPTVASRLKHLDSLKEQGLITADEWQEKRREVLGSI